MMNHMKKYITVAGALVLLMSGLPAIAFAESDSIEVGVNAEVRAQVQGVDASASVTARADESMDGQKQEIKGQEDQLEMSWSEQKDDEEMRDEDRDDFDFEDEFEFELEDDEDVASSLDDLKQKIEDRRHELEDEEASTTPKFKNAMKNANEVRLAVHALLASKDLLGGIGQEVSEIAKHMNDSVATTTSAEAQIESRSFLVKLFFGGDQKVAKVISKEVERNQKSIKKLTELLEQTTLSVDFQTTLKAQITALEEARARFQVLAEKEQNRWGIFSWRF